MGDLWEMMGIHNISLSAMADNSTATDCSPELTAAMHSAWVLKYFRECVTNVRQWFAFVVGMLSIVFWLFAQVPQLVVNCRTGKGDEALSFWFLLLWLLGDSANFIGAFLSKQLATEVGTALYHVALDILTVGQYIFYVFKNQGRWGLYYAFVCRSDRTERRNNVVLSLLLPVLISSVFLATGIPHLTLYRSQQLYDTPSKAGRALLWDKRIIDLNDKLYVTGYVFGVCSAGFYVIARVPQIVKNFVRCSLEGLSVHMFVLAILGNVTFALGILLYSVDGIFLLQKLPWLVGSLGTMVFDIIIITHFIINKTSGGCAARRDDTADEREPLIVKECEADGDSPQQKTLWSVQTMRRVQGSLPAQGGELHKTETTGLLRSTENMYTHN